MSKKNKSAAAVAPTRAPLAAVPDLEEEVEGTEEETDEDETTEAEAAVVPAKPVDRAAITKILASYDKKEAEVAQLTAKIAAVHASKSDDVKALLDAGCPKKFKYQGHDVTIISKKNKSTSNMTHFLRGKVNAADVLDLDSAE